jgi:hypothetical protein
MENPKEKIIDNVIVDRYVLKSFEISEHLLTKTGISPQRAYDIFRKNFKTRV